LFRRGQIKIVAFNQRVPGIAAAQQQQQAAVAAAAAAAAAG